MFEDLPRTGRPLDLQAIDLLSGPQPKVKSRVRGGRIAEPQ